MRKTVFKLHLVTATALIIDLIIALSICEIYIRLFIPVENISYYVDDVIGVRYSPNQRSVAHTQPGYTNTATTNSFGFHDIERNYTVKSDDAILVHVYGDSIVAGMGVDISNTIPSEIERRLNDSYNQKLEFKVANMAAGSESTCGQLMTYRSIGIFQSPDIVMLYFMGDFTDNVKALSGKKHTPYFLLDDKGNLVFIPPVPKNENRIMANLKRKWFMTYRLFANKLLESKSYNDFILAKKAILAYFNSKNKSEKSFTKNYMDLNKEIYINVSWPVTLALIKQFHSETQANGSQFIVVDGRPFIKPITDNYSNDDLKTFCNSYSIPYIDAYKEYERLQCSENSDRYFLNDGHPTALGNELLANYIVDRLIPIATNR